ncbi:hypothetical protein [Actinoplanes sp. N902-109]|uniref:hypothetical protein n=1 Tax=Actinoplanes sp. (strain N902-109) TaxID=649831 RepID=UPI00032944CE|nr:hypothetical protein [Actinoplanes sp. N902-109]AGL18391.1 hypothetical protein L083_4881 [Actinoplanes sp. N902-109]
MRRLSLLATAACATALAACSPIDTTSAAAPAASGPAGSSYGSTASLGAPQPAPATTTATRTPKPAATTTAPRPVTTTTKPPTAADWSKVNWRTTVWGALGCKHYADLTDAADLAATRYADLTGDGRKEAIVAGSCPTTTATNQVRVFVYAGDKTTTPLELLVTIGKDDYLQSADITTGDHAITVVAKALSDKAPRCCADLRITQTYTYRNGSFTRTARDEQAI